MTPEGLAEAATRAIISLVVAVQSRVPADERGDQKSVEDLCR
jgi:hypothetical protein